MGYLNLTSVTFWAGVGLVALGCFQVSQGDNESGIGHITQGLTAIGLRRAVESAQTPTNVETSGEVKSKEP